MGETAAFDAVGRPIYSATLNVKCGLRREQSVITSSTEG